MLADERSSGLRLRVLGTQTPYPRAGSACSGYVIEGHGITIVLDLGAGTLAELTRRQPVTTLDGILLSHNHADHSSDVLALYYALAFSELRPAKRLPVYGPSDWDTRMEAFLASTSPNPMGRVFDVHALDGATEASIGSLGLRWTKVEHGVEAYACRVSDGKVAMVYSGDTRRCEALVSLAAGAELFLCEAGANAPDDSEWHMTPEDAGHVAKQARVGSLVLTHLAPGLDAQDALSRAASQFAGNIRVAVQGEVIRLGK